MLFLGVIRWDTLLKVHEIYLPFLRVLRIYSVGLFFNTFMVGVTGGDLAKIYYVSKHSHKNVEAGTTVVIDRLVGMIALMLLVLVAVWVYRYDDRLNPLLRPVSIVTISVLAGFVVISSKKLLLKIPLLSSLIGKLPFREMLSRIYHTWYAYRECKGAMIKAIILSLLIHMTLAMANYWAGMAIGIQQISMGQYFVLIPVISFMCALPLSISGWGVGEAAYISLLGAFGVEPAQAITLSLFFKCFYLFTGLSCVSAYVAPGLTRYPLTTKE